MRKFYWPRCNGSFLSHRLSNRFTIVWYDPKCVKSCAYITASTSTEKMNFYWRDLQSANSRSKSELVTSLHDRFITGQSIFSFAYKYASFVCAAKSVCFFRTMHTWKTLIKSRLRVHKSSTRPMYDSTFIRPSSDFTDELRHTQAKFARHTYAFMCIMMKTDFRKRTSHEYSWLVTMVMIMNLVFRHM